MKKWDLFKATNNKAGLECVFWSSGDPTSGDRANSFRKSSDHIPGMYVCRLVPGVRLRWDRLGHPVVWDSLERRVTVWMRGGRVWETRCCLGSESKARMIGGVSRRLVGAAGTV